jgi:DinB superfamily
MFWANLKRPANRTNFQIIDFMLDYQQKQLLDVAEAMPAEEYEFVPTGGAFQGVRSFAEQLKHVAADNYMLGAGIIGEKTPGNVGPNESGSSSVRTKPQIIAYLPDSFAYMRRAAAAIDDAKTPIPTPDISPWPEGTATRLGVAIEDCVHTWDHYGQLVEYLRMNDIVPPESRTGANQVAMADGSPSMSLALDFWISNTEKQVISAADAMPEEKYSFAPTAGEFAGVRTFAEQVKHLAANNYRMAARMLGQNATPDQEAETGPDNVRSKEEILRYLKGSFSAFTSERSHHHRKKRCKSGVSWRGRHGQAEYARSVRGRCRRTLLRSLRSDGGVPANERRCSPGKSLN